VLAAVEAGLADVGESYAQELIAKVSAIEDLALEAVPPAVRWHAIGRLQRNKVRALAPHVHLWQSIDRLSLAAEVARHAPAASVLVQVNVAGAAQQGGCPPERVAAVVDGCRDLGLDVRGLMAIGPQGGAATVRAGFRRLRELADHLGLPERSMGMSGDLEAAVAEGATMVRIGSALFGPRPGASPVGK
jgi:pyridoxal phosphate enzyme (YggS family)